jgi:hypothetical protein
MKTPISLAIVVLNFINVAIGQGGNMFAGVTDDSVKFEICRVGPNFIGSGKISRPQILIKVTSGKIDSKLLKKLKRSDWLKGLSDPRTDWAVNLLLYHIYEKDATSFLVIKSRAQWIRNNRASDIRYWTGRLK